MAAGKQGAPKTTEKFLYSQWDSVAAAICAEGNICSYARHVRGDPVLELMASAGGNNKRIFDYIHVAQNVHMVC